MSFVSKFVHGLMSDDKVESSQITGPRGLQEAALHELNPRCLLAKALGGQLMHGGGKIQRDVTSDARHVVEQVLGQKAGARTEFKHLNTAKPCKALNLTSECFKEIRSPRTLLHGR